MAFLITQNPFSHPMDEDTMETSSDHGRIEDFDIEIEGVNTPGTHDDLMDDTVQADADDDDMNDDMAPEEPREEDMEDFVEDEDEVLEDVDYDAQTTVEPSHSLDYDLIDDGVAEVETVLHTEHQDESDTMVKDVAEVGALQQGGGPSSPGTTAASGHGIGQQQQDGQDKAVTVDDEDGGVPEAFKLEEKTNPEEPVPEAQDSLPAPEDDSPQTMHQELHPCIVEWQSVEMSLFKDENFEQFLVEDASDAYKPLTHLFGECRKVLNDSIEDNVELVFDVPQLALRIREDVVISSTCTMGDIIDIYVNLSLNDGVDNPQPLQVVLTSKTKFESRIDELREAATSGHGLSQIAEMYSPEEEEQVENLPGEEANKEGDAISRAVPTSTLGVDGNGEGEEEQKEDALPTEEEIESATQPAVSEQVEENNKADNNAENAEVTESTTTSLQGDESCPGIDASAELRRGDDDVQSLPNPPIQNPSNDEITGSNNFPSSGSSTALGDGEEQELEVDLENHDQDYSTGDATAETSGEHGAEEGEDFFGDEIEDAGEDEITHDRHPSQEGDEEEGNEAQGEDAAETYNDDYSDHESEADTPKGNDRQDGSHAPEGDVFGEQNTAPEAMSDQTVRVGQEEHNDESTQPFQDGEADEFEETYDEEGIEYEDPEAYANPEDDQPNTIFDGPTEAQNGVPEDAVQKQHQASSPTSLPRKRSFSELDELDEITDDIDLKKARPI